MVTIAFLLAVLSQTISADQPACQLLTGYAYQQSTISGTRPRSKLGESGKVIESAPKAMSTLFVFIESTGKCVPEISAIWIGNKAYRVSHERIDSLPVIIHPGHPGALPDTIVKRTANAVYQIHPTEEWKSKVRKKNYGAGKILIEYKSNFKTKYFSIAEIKKIAPMVLQ